MIPPAGSESMVSPPSSDKESAPPPRAARPDKAQRWFIGIILTLALIWALRATASFTVPLACALLIALAVWPVCKMVRDAVPGKVRWLGSVAAMLVVIGLLAIFLFGLGLAARQVVELASEVAPQLEQKLQQSPLGPMIGQQGQQMGSALTDAGSRALGAITTAGHILAALVLILFLVLLMLTESRIWKDKAAVFSTDGRDWAAIGGTAGRKFRTFFFTRLLLGAITALLYVGWLALFGVEYLLLWGLLAVLLNFLPTIGSLIAGTLPVLYAVVQKDFATAAAVAGGLLVIEQIMGNFVDPKLMGRQLSLSPLVVLVSLLFWAWVWGIAGAFLAVPLTILLVIIFAHVEPLKPIALLLSNERGMAELERHSETGQ